MTEGPRHVITVGESMGLVTNERPGPLAASRAHSLSFGGAESNVAVALSRLGVRASWVSRLGDDPLGDLIARELRAENVDVYASRSPDRPTGIMHKHRRTTTTATVSFWRAGSAASALHPSDLPVDVLATADVVHLTGILAGLGSDSLDCALESVRLARAAGATVSFDVNHRDAVWRERDPRPVYEQLVSAADIVFAGEDEAALLVGNAEAPVLAERLRRLGPREVVIKRGARGAFASDGTTCHEEPARRVDVVDTVGAGDAFVAGYLSLCGGSAPLVERLRRGVAVGAFACTSAGDWEGSPTLAELSRMDDEEGVVR